MNKSLESITQALVHNEKPFEDVIINGITANSLEIEKGNLFIAIQGNKQDGHDFIYDAIKSGAIAIISNGRGIGKIKEAELNGDVDKFLDEFNEIILDNSSNEEN